MFEPAGFDVCLTVGLVLFAFGVALPYVRLALGRPSGGIDGAPTVVELFGEGKGWRGTRLDISYDIALIGVLFILQATAQTNYPDGYLKTIHLGATSKRGSQQTILPAPRCRREGSSDDRMVAPRRQPDPIRQPQASLFGRCSRWSTSSSSSSSCSLRESPTRPSTGCSRWGAGSCADGGAVGAALRVNQSRLGRGSGSKTGSLVAAATTWMACLRCRAKDYQVTANSVYSDPHVPLSSIALKVLTPQVIGMIMYISFA